MAQGIIHHNGPSRRTTLPIVILSKQVTTRFVLWCDWLFFTPERTSLNMHAHTVPSLLPDCNCETWLCLKLTCAIGTAQDMHASRLWSSVVGFGAFCAWNVKLERHTGSFSLSEPSIGHLNYFLAALLCVHEGLDDRHRLLLSVDFEHRSPGCHSLHPQDSCCEWMVFERM